MAPIGAAIVAHQAGDGHAMALEPGDGASGEGAGRLLLLVGQHFGVGKA